MIRADVLFFISDISPRNLFDSIADRNVLASEKPKTRFDYNYFSIRFYGTVGYNYGTGGTT